MDNEEIKEQLERIESKIDSIDCGNNDYGCLAFAILFAAMLIASKL